MSKFFPSLVKASQSLPNFPQCVKASKSMSRNLQRSQSNFTQHVKLLNFVLVSQGLYRFPQSKFDPFNQSLVSCIVKSYMRPDFLIGYIGSQFRGATPLIPMSLHASHQTPMQSWDPVRTISCSKPYYPEHQPSRALIFGASFAKDLPSEGIHQIKIPQ